MMRAGYIDYSNSYPFLREAEINPIEDITVEAHAPGILNKMLSESKLELSAISAFEYMRHSNQYWLLPELCINSFGYVKSVLLYSKVPMEELSNEEISTTPESATSIQLLNILLHEKGVEAYKLKNFAPNENLQQKKALLLIGDGALRFDTSHHKYVYDLAKEWSDLFQLPVVFALWAIRRDYPKSYKGLVSAYLNQHLKARDLLQGQPELIAKEAEKRYPMPNLNFIEYFESLDYKLKPSCIESLNFYASKLIELGTLKHQPEFTFIDI